MQSLTSLKKKIPSIAERLLVEALVDALAIRIAEIKRKDPLVMHRGSFNLSQAWRDWLNK